MTVTTNPAPTASGATPVPPAGCEASASDGVDFAALLGQFLDVLTLAGVSEAQCAAVQSDATSTKRDDESIAEEGDATTGFDSDDTRGKAKAEDPKERTPESAASPSWAWSVQQVVVADTTPLPPCLTFTLGLNPRAADDGQGNAQTGEQAASQLFLSPQTSPVDVPSQAPSRAENSDSFTLAFAALLEPRDRHSDGKAGQHSRSDQSPGAQQQSQPRVPVMPEASGPTSPSVANAAAAFRKADAPARITSRPETKGDESKADPTARTLHSQQSHPVVAPVAAAVSRGESTGPQADAPPGQPASALPPEVAKDTLTTPPPAPGSISLSVGDGGPDRVEVRVQERQGAVQVAVRSSDPELSAALRGDLNDLVSRLENRGYKTETWAPSETAPVRSSQQSASTDNHSNTRQGNSPGGDEPGRQQQGDGRRGHREQRPRWLEEFETSRSQKGRGK